MGKWAKYLLYQHRNDDGENHIDIEDMARLVDGQVDADEREAFHYHLNRCTDCYEIFITALSATESRTRSPASHKGLYALAASILLFVIIGSGILYSPWRPFSRAITATLEMDQELRSIFLENDLLARKKPDRIQRLKKLLIDKGVKADAVSSVLLASVYLPSKDFFSPEEKVFIQIKDGVAYIEIKQTKKK